METVALLMGWLARSRIVPVKSGRAADFSVCPPASVTNPSASKSSPVKARQSPAFTAEDLQGMHCDIQFFIGLLSLGGNKLVVSPPEATTKWMRHLFSSLHPRADGLAPRALVVGVAGRHAEPVFHPARKSGVVG